MKEKIPFNIPGYTNESKDFLLQSLKSGKMSGRGPFTNLCEQWLDDYYDNNSKALLTTSCTHALEIAAILMNLSENDEVIVPSYTFVTSALAFHMHGAKLRFCDIRKDTLNIDEDLLEQAITENTRAIVVVHYAGVACEMDKIMEIASKHNLLVIEDNAHGIFGKYKDRKLGTIGDFSTLSFHETKNISCGEGGALIINNDRFIQRAEIILEKGTDRSQFIKGQVDKYSWVDKGSSYVMADTLAAWLYGQLRNSEEIQTKRNLLWDQYVDGLSKWASSNDVVLPFIPEHTKQSYHMFYLLLPSLSLRDGLIDHLMSDQISSAFHYLPLDISKMGAKIQLRDQLECPVSSVISQRIVRLPLFYNLELDDQSRVINSIKTL
tara:strand:- start:445 stop:1581 length:1137 start_codon:yes stop_codon:yes gene_type:complete